ncbi:UNKNOWN [Stylonychia lemnae]|uniref:Uncharacterized protein n=1 Tax=Stylonychia lemnae TaxID=5949 RepID=A0A078A659_STYLE|nr:UNKNOWN [Stylonychia lemnae]|eukprot:CDW77684.1 UNKNOWN [Stylonychia lemnae]
MLDYKLDSSSSSSNSAFQSKQKIMKQNILLDNISDDSSMDLKLNDEEDQEDNEQWNNEDNSYIDHQKQPQNERNNSSSISNDRKQPQYNQGQQPHQRDQGQPKKNLIEPRSKRGVNIFQRKRKDIISEVVKNKKIDFGESGEEVKIIIQERQSIMRSLNSSRMESSPKSSKYSKAQPSKANLFDIIGKQGKVDEASSEQENNENSPSQQIEGSLEGSHKRIDQVVELKGILKNAQSQSSKASQSLRHFGIGGLNIELHSKKIDPRGSEVRFALDQNYINSQSSCSKRSSFNFEFKGQHYRSQDNKSTDNKKNVQILDKKPPIQSYYMNVLNNDEGFKNLKKDYPNTETEVLADYYMKNELDVKKTIKDLYQKLKLIPYDPSFKSEESKSEQSKQSSNKNEDIKSSDSNNKSNQLDKSNIKKKNHIVGKNIIQDSLKNTIVSSSNHSDNQQKDVENLRFQNIGGLKRSLSKNMEGPNNKQRESFLDYDIKHNKIKNNQGTPTNKNENSQDSSFERSGSNSSKQLQQRNLSSLDQSYSFKDRASRPSSNGHFTIGSAQTFNIQKSQKKQEENKHVVKQNSIFEKINHLKKTPVQQQDSPQGEKQRQQDFNNDVSNTLSQILNKEKNPQVIIDDFSQSFDNDFDSEKLKKTSMDIEQQTKSTQPKQMKSILKNQNQDVYRTGTFGMNNQAMQNKDSPPKQSTNAACCMGFFNKPKDLNKGKNTDISGQNTTQQPVLIHEKMSFFKRFL